MVEPQEIRAAVTELVRCYIDALKNKNLSYAKIAERLGISKPLVQQIHNRKKYDKKINSDTETKVARVLNNDSIDQLRLSALALAKGTSLLVSDGVEEVVVRPHEAADPLDLTPSSIPPAARRRG